jgi:hypothetical protein
LALAVFIPFGVFQLARSFIPTIVLHAQLTVPLDSISMILSLVLGWFLYSRVSEQISITQATASETAGFQPAA